MRGIAGLSWKHIAWQFGMTAVALYLANTLSVSTPTVAKLFRPAAGPITNA